MVRLSEQILIFKLESIAKTYSKLIHLKKLIRSLVFIRELESPKQLYRNTVAFLTSDEKLQFSAKISRINTNP